jgi:sporulation protein YlmC with PRC-barrel domain
MRKGSDVIGKVIVTYDTGRKIDYIRDLIFDQKRNQLLGFLVEAISGCEGDSSARSASDRARCDRDSLKSICG